MVGTLFETPYDDVRQAARQAGPGGPHPMRAGEKLFKSLAGLMLDKFYGTVTIKFESGKVTHVETETRRMWQYKDLPESPSSGK